MGILDDSVNGCFKTTSDGRKVFYPWGYVFGRYLARGYVVDSDREFERLRWQMSLWMKVGGSIMFAGAAGIRGLMDHWGYTGPFAMLAPGGFAVLMAALFAAWIFFKCRGLERSDDKRWSRV